MIIKCGNCEREWDYKGNSTGYATCPNCMRKTRVTKEAKRD